MNLFRTFAGRLLLTSILLTSAAQLLFRYAMQRGGTFAGVEPSSVISTLGAFTSDQALALLAGVLLYAVSMLAWVVALTRYSVSFAYPLLSLSYILVYIAATQLPALNESASLVQVVGVGLIVTGIWFLSRGQQSQST